MQSTSRSTSRVWGLVLVLCLGVIASAWIKLKPGEAPAPSQTAHPDLRCKLSREACGARLPNGAVVRLEIQPLGIPLAKPLLLKVTTDGLTADRVEVDFSGVDMDMGYNRVTLERRHERSFKGPAMLPVCVRASMTWEAKVLLHTPQGLIMAPFRFDTFQPGLPSIGR